MLWVWLIYETPLEFSHKKVLPLSYTSSMAPKEQENPSATHPPAQPYAGYIAFLLTALAVLLLGMLVAHSIMVVKMGTLNNQLSTMAHDFSYATLTVKPAPFATVYVVQGR